MAENQQNKALTAFRSEIDKIDNQIISLLEDRMAIITKVADLKKNNQEKFFIKSAREADMIKDLVKKSDIIPQTTIVNIWRKIITAANMREQPLHIAIHNPKNISDYAFLVREYYSDAVAISMSDSATNVVSELEKGVAQIGIFQLPQNDSENSAENWWINLANNRLGLRVFAKIPPVEYSGHEKNFEAIQLVAAAIKEPEKSSSDNSLLYVELSKEISKSQLISTLKESGIDGRILKSVRLPQVEAVVFYLLDVVGFFDENDAIISAFKKSEIKPYTKVLGHYATPIKISSWQKALHSQDARPFKFFPLKKSVF